MTRRSHRFACLLFAWFIAALAGCGQMGPLTLADRNDTEQQDAEQEDTSDEENER